MYSTTITFDAADHDAAVAEINSWGLPAGATVHSLMTMDVVDGMPATVSSKSGKLEPHTAPLPTVADLTEPTS